MSKVTLSYRIEAYEVQLNDHEYVVMKSWMSRTQTTEYAVFDFMGEDIPDETIIKEVIDVIEKWKKETLNGLS